MSYRLQPPVSISGPDNMLQRLDYLIQAVGRIEGRQEGFRQSIQHTQTDLKDHTQRIQRLEHHLSVMLAIASPKTWWIILVVGAALFGGPEALTLLKQVKGLVSH